MTELERLAQLGDKEAQAVGRQQLFWVLDDEECTRQGILLPCPFCGCGMNMCNWCGAKTSEAGNKVLAIAASNRRPAPPVGRCAGCDNWYKGHCASGPCATMETDPGFYCGNFSPKKRDNHENI